MKSLRVHLPFVAAQEIWDLRDEAKPHSVADMKTRQSAKIREIGAALTKAGCVSLDVQALALGLPRSTAWTILSAAHKSSGLSAKIICRMLNAQRLPPPVREKIMEYAKEKAAGLYGANPAQTRRFVSALRSTGADVRPRIAA